MIRGIYTYWFGVITIITMATPIKTWAGNVKEPINIYTQEFKTKTLETKLYTAQLTENMADDVHKVVIDAGHGGHDPGCRGAHSVEKDIALEIALKAGATLKRLYPEVEIIYTRKKDVFIPLHKRIKIANDKKADIFVSIHCNYVGNSKICGTETYVMGLHRAEENLKVAKRENASVLLEDNFETHYEGYDPNSPIGHIVLSAFQNMHLDRSIALASSIEDKLNTRKKYKSRGVKQAGFVVLRQAAMPSILVETGFLSNIKEEKYLTSSTGQQEVATSISESVADYFKINIPIRSKELVKETPPKTDIAHFTIQIGVYSSNKKNFDKVEAVTGSLEILQVGKVYKYTTGRYQHKAAAKKDLKKVKKAGAKDAFIKAL